MPVIYHETNPADFAPADDVSGPETGTAGTIDAGLGELAARFVTFLETGKLPERTFSTDVFCDFTMPQWRLQAQGSDHVVALRLAGHPRPGRVPRSRLDVTQTGFVIEVEERWEDDGSSWYCRELFRADVADGVICALSVYCTGDWDAELEARYARTVQLIRP